MRTARYRWPKLASYAFPVIGNLWVAGIDQRHWYIPFLTFLGVPFIRGEALQFSVYEAYLVTLIQCKLAQTGDLADFVGVPVAFNSPLG